MLNPFRRYRPPASQTDIAPPPMPGAYLPQLGGMDSGDQGSNYSESPDAADFSGGDATGPALRLQQAPPPMPDLSRKPPMMAGGPPPEIAQQQLPAPPPLTAGPPPMNGGPAPAGQNGAERLIQQAADDRAKLALPAEPKENLGQKIAKTALAFTRFAPAAEQIVHPNYSAQMRQYGAQLADVDDRLKTAEGATTAEANAEYRRGMTDTRKQTAENNTAKIADTFQEHGGVFLPAGAQPTVGPDGQPSLVQTVHPLPNDQRFAGFTAYHDPHFGQTYISPDMAAKTGVPVGWLDKKAYEDVIRNVSQRQKPDTVSVSPATAQAMGIHPAPGPDGTVQVPTSAFNAYQTASAKPDQLNALTLAARAQGKTTGNKMVDSMSAQEAKAALEMSKEKPAQTTIINPAEQSSIDANAQMIANYQSAPLNGFVMRSPEGRAIMKRVGEINKDYHAEYYNNFNRTETDATTGKIGSSANALNTMMGHLAVLNDASDALKSNNVQIINRLANAVGVQVGATPVTTYQTIVHRLGPEITKAYVSSGGSLGEREAAELDFDPKMGPDQIKQNVAVSALLADSKIKALQDQYQRGTYGRGQQKLISDEAEAARQKLAGGYRGPGRSGGGTVRMKAPNGQVNDVPADQVEHFKSLGAQVVK